jgi:hypothetical protein
LDPVDFPEDKRKLDCWLGPAHNIGDALCARILGSNSQIISRTTYSPLSTSDLDSQQVKLLQESFEKNVCFVMNKDDCVKNTHVFEVEPSEFETYSDHYTGDQETMQQADEYNHEAFNKYINAEVVIPKRDHIGAGQIFGQKKDQDGNPIGRLKPDPVLDTRILEVQFPDSNICQRQVSPGF